MIHYCIHCERTFEGPDDAFEAGVEDTTEKAPFEGARRCVYEDCDGSPIDFWPYHEKIRANRSPEEQAFFPEVPEHGKHYPMYPLAPEPAPDDRIKCLPAEASDRVVSAVKGVLYSMDHATRLVKLNPPKVIADHAVQQREDRAKALHRLVREEAKTAGVPVHKVIRAANRVATQEKPGACIVF